MEELNPAPVAPEPNPAPAAPPEAAPPVEEAPKPTAAEAMEIYERALATDRKIQEQRAELKRREQELEAQRGDWETKAQRAERLQRLVEEDPVAFLEETGVKFEDFQSALARNRQLDPRVRELSEKLNEVTSKLEQREKTEAEREASAKRNTAITEFRGVVSSNTDEYSLTNHVFESDPENATGLLQDVASDLYQATGKVPGYEETAAEIERLLVEDTRARLSTPAGRKLAAAILAEAQEGTPESEQTKQPAQHANPGESAGDGPSTIANHHAAAPGPRGNRRASRKEKMSALYDAARKDGIGW